MVGLVDVGSPGGLFAQINGRTSKAVIDWLEAQDPAWQARITHVAMDTSATYARAARIALPNAKVVVDRFRLFALAMSARTSAEAIGSAAGVAISGPPALGGP